MNAIEQIRSRIDREIFDYSQLNDVLSDYSKPRDVVTKLLSQGKIIRIRKGLYTFGDVWRKTHVEPVALAGLIFGPSAISLDFALAWYGLIPERATSITSITPARSRSFDTPVGRFTYTQLGLEKFSCCLSLRQSNSGGFFIAEPLKALADKVWTDTRCRPESPGYFNDYLFADLRIDEGLLADVISGTDFNEVKKAYHTRKIDFLIDFLKNHLNY